MCNVETLKSLFHLLFFPCFPLLFQNGVLLYENGITRYITRKRRSNLLQLHLINQVVAQYVQHPCSLLADVGTFAVMFTKKRDSE